MPMEPASLMIATWQRPSWNCSMLCTFTRCIGTPSGARLLYSTLPVCGSRIKRRVLPVSSATLLSPKWFTS